MKKYVSWIFFIYAGLFLCVSYLKYARFLYTDFDLTIAGLTLANLARGEFVSRLYGMAAILSSGHMPFISFLFLPFYWIFPSALTLIFLQTIFLASGVFAVYLIAKEIAGEEWAIYPAIIYAFYPALQYINLYEVHFVAFSIPLLLFAFFFYLKKRFAPFVAFMLLALFCREEVLLALAGLGAYIILRSRMDKKPFPLKWIAAILFAALFFVSVFLLLFASPGNIGKAMSDPGKFGSAYLFAYTWITEASGPAAVLRHILSLHNMKYMLELMLPLAFLCLLDISFLMVVFSVAHVLLSGWPLHANIYFQHSSIAIPFLFISFIFGMKRIISIRMAEQAKRRLLAGLFSFCIISALFIGPLPRILSGVETAVPEDNPAYVKMKEYILARAPENEPLITTFAFSTHLINRRALAPFYIFTYDKALDYIPQVRSEYAAAVIDFDDRLTFYSFFYTAKEGLLSRAFFAGEGWGLTETLDNMAVYKKGALADFKLLESLGVRRDLLDGSEGELKVINSDFRRSVVGRFPVLETSFDIIKNRSGGDYIPVLQITNKSGRKFEFRYLAAYRLYPFREWKEAEVVRIKARVFIPREFRGEGAETSEASLSFLKLGAK